MAVVIAYQTREIYSLYICFFMLLRCIPFCSYLMEPAGRGAPQRMLSQAQHQYYWVAAVADPTVFWVVSGLPQISGDQGNGAL
jgi:hypothetical protein